MGPEATSYVRCGADSLETIFSGPLPPPMAPPAPATPVAPQTPPPAATRQNLFGTVLTENERVTTTNYAAASSPAVRGSHSLSHPSYVAMGPRATLVATVAAIVAAAFTLPAAVELGVVLPPALPAQPHLLLFVACFLLGALLECATDALHVRLTILSEAASAAAVASAAYVGASGSPAPAPTAWREIVEGVRMLGAIVVQPALCAALGLLPMRGALWGAAALAALVGVCAGGHALCLYVVFAKRRSVDERRRHLLGEGHTTDGTPETLLLTSSATGDHDRTTASPSSAARPETLGSTPGINTSMDSEGCNTSTESEG
jgi:hypothetical protein